MDRYSIKIDGIEYKIRLEDDQSHSVVINYQDKPPEVVKIKEKPWGLIPELCLTKYLKDELNIDTEKLISLYESHITGKIYTVEPLGNNTNRVGGQIHFTINGVESKELFKLKSLTNDVLDGLMLHLNDNSLFRVNNNLTKITYVEEDEEVDMLVEEEEEKKLVTVTVKDLEGNESTFEGIYAEIISAINIVDGETLRTSRITISSHPIPEKDDLNDLSDPY